MPLSGSCLFYMPPRVSVGRGDSVCQCPYRAAVFSTAKKLVGSTFNGTVSMPLSGGCLFYKQHSSPMKRKQGSVNALIGRLSFLQRKELNSIWKYVMCQCPYRAASFSTLLDMEYNPEADDLCQCPYRAASFSTQLRKNKLLNKVCVNALIGRLPFLQN